MPCSVLMPFRNQKHLKLSIILFTLVPDKLHEPGGVGVQIVAIHLVPIQRAGEEVLPRIAQGVLQHHVSGAGEIAVQLDLIVLLFLPVTHIHDVRIPHAFERHDLEHVFPVLVNCV